MIQIDPSHWTADFRIARALTEAYHASMRSDVLFVCVGDPADPVGRLGPIVGDETRKYYPSVIGTSDEPVTGATFARWARVVAERRPEAFVIAIEAGYGRPDQLGAVMVTDRPLTTVGNVEELWDFADVTVNAILRVRTQLHPPAAGLSAAEAGAATGPGAGPGKGARGQGLAAAGREVGSDEPGGEPGEEPGRKKFKPLRPDQIDRARVQKIADVVIDGNLRLLAKIGKQEI